MEYSNNIFPEDLMIEILSRLPVTSLVRFRCVCKSWFIMFQDSTFINKHLKNSKNNNDHRRLLVGRRLGNVGTFMSLSYESLDVVNHDLGFRHYDGITIHNLWICYDLLGSFNGVICLSRSGGGGGVVFWNPATRQMKIVEESNIPSDPPAGVQFDSTNYGFGYDFRANDYKVVTRTSFLDVFDNIFHRFEVYSLDSDSWHSIDAVLPTGITFYEPDYEKTCYFVCQKAFMNGHHSRLVNIAGPGKIRKDYVLTLDMTEEIFILTPLPDDEEILMLTPLLNPLEIIEYERHKALFPLNDSIALITFPSQSNLKSYYVKSYEISVLNEYGPNGCWTKLYTGDLFPDECIPLGFWKSGALFLENVGEELVMYDLRTRELKVLPSRDFGPLQLIEYTESLVSVD